MQSSYSFCLREDDGVRLYKISVKQAGMNPNSLITGFTLLKPTPHDILTLSYDMVKEIEG